MLEIYTVSFLGHRELHNHRQVEERLIPILKELLRSKPYVSFLVGRQGEFDEYVASLIKRVQKEIGKENNDLTLVLPYTVADLEYYEGYYDHVLLPDAVNGLHPKSAITRKNQWMVEASDLVIVNVAHRSGGAYTAMKYAKKCEKKLLFLNEIDF